MDVATEIKAILSWTKLRATVERVVAELRTENKHLQDDIDHLRSEREQDD